MIIIIFDPGFSTVIGSGCEDMNFPTKIKCVMCVCALTHVFHMNRNGSVFAFFSLFE